AMWLQEMMAHITQASLSLFGVPIQAEGNLLTINGQPVAVAEACNGLRMVFMLALVSYGFAFGTPLRNYVRVMIVAASPVLALICNVIRMLPTVLMYGYASREAADLFHEMAPWGMLLLAVGLLLGGIRSMQWAMFPVTKYNLAYDR
ncbi:MAG: exosortase/archaeosortase family protein, partial [Phycisphaeraceae bacterium]|nr:exosortase/archaeosortase family protein [Phycisphaeraceae bacterium]